MPENVCGGQLSLMAEGQRFHQNSQGCSTVFVLALFTSAKGDQPRSSANVDC